MMSSIVQGLMPSFVHDLSFAKSSNLYHASGTNHSWHKKFRLYHDYCKSVYDGPKPTAEIKDAVERYHHDGYFAFANADTEQLAISVAAKLASAPDNWGDIDPQYGSRYYRSDIYQAFPECASLFQGITGDIIRGCLGCHFKIFFGVMFQSEHSADKPSGSQLWHSDGGPGTVLNFFFHISPVGEFNGGTEILPWPDTVKVYTSIRREVAQMEREQAKKLDCGERAQLREKQVDLWTKTIDSRYADKTVKLAHPQPGLVAGFRNNILHRGGFVPDLNAERIVWMIHIYPSDKPTPFDQYAKSGVRKRAPVLHDPAGY